MADLPAWALAIVICTALAAALAMLSVLARAARNEIEVHAFKIRVTTLRADYERALKALRGEVEGEFDILGDDEIIEAIPIDELEDEAEIVADVVGEATEEPARAAA